MNVYFCSPILGSQYKKPHPGDGHPRVTGRTAGKGTIPCEGPYHMLE